MFDNKTPFYSKFGFKPDIYEKSVYVKEHRKKGVYMLRLKTTLKELAAATESHSSRIKPNILFDICKMTIVCKFISPILRLQ